ncbi:hypothetical protein GGD50_003347 [Rhizobium paranaense]|uniref:Uncharacterized protein n=1 Tax=Rhizobium paranaense TaxID=1650438 RepID=A0A7W8XSE4_9HYPH|nr:hypothetical protein [Rhizobium paranaense]
MKHLVPRILVKIRLNMVSANNLGTARPQISGESVATAKHDET